MKHCDMGEVVLGDRPLLNFLIFEKNEDNGWELKATQPAPDAASACEFYLGRFFEAKRRFDGMGRWAKKIGVTLNFLPATLGQKFPESVSENFTFLYNGW